MSGMEKLRRSETRPSKCPHRAGEQYPQHPLIGESTIGRPLSGPAPGSGLASCTRADRGDARGCGVRLTVSSRAAPRTPVLRALPRRSRPWRAGPLTRAQGAERDSMDRAKCRVASCDPLADHGRLSPPRPPIRDIPVSVAMPDRSESAVLAGARVPRPASLRFCPERRQYVPDPAIFRSGQAEA